MTQEKSLSLLGFLEKNTQVGWLDTPISILPSLLVELGIWQIVGHDGSWVKMMLKSLLVSNKVLVRSQFFQTFYENNLRFFKIMIVCHLQLNKLIWPCFHGSLDIFLSTTLY